VSIIDPLKKTDWLVKESKVRELLCECEIGEGFMEKVNQKVIQLILEADMRRKYNRRKRIYPCDL